MARRHTSTQLRSWYLGSVNKEGWGLIKAGAGGRGSRGGGAGEQLRGECMGRGAGGGCRRRRRWPPLLRKRLPRAAAAAWSLAAPPPAPVRQHHAGQQLLRRCLGRHRAGVGRAEHHLGGLLLGGARHLGAARGVLGARARRRGGERGAGGRLVAAAAASAKARGPALWHASARGRTLSAMTRALRQVQFCSRARK
jgi:hypothetical protein